MKDKCTAIVLAAGQGKRMGTKVQKQFLDIQGKPVLYYSLECFEKTAFIDDIILVTGEESITYCQKEIVEKYDFHKVSQVIAGGKERYDSVYQGLLACQETDYVYIHDGARPFITQEMLRRALDGVMRYGACAVGMPAKDTVKIADEQQCVESTPQRSRVWTVQTPQVFAYKLIRKAHEQIRRGDMSDITDDAMVVEKTGVCNIKLVEGSYENIKITTPEDLDIANVFCHMGNPSIESLPTKKIGQILENDIDSEKL